MARHYYCYAHIGFTTDLKSCPTHATGNKTEWATHNNFPQIAYELGTLCFSTDSYYIFAVEDQSYLVN